MTDSTGTPAESAGTDVTAGIVRLGTVTPVKPGSERALPASEENAIAPALVLPTATAHQRRRRIAFKLAALLSLLLHAGSLYAFLIWDDNTEIGALDTPSEAISVEIVETRTLEAMQPRPAAEPAPSPEATAPVEGKTEASNAQTARPEPERQPETEITVPRPPIVIPDAMEEVMRAIERETPKTAEAPPVPVAGPAEAPPSPPKSGDDEEDAAAKQKERKQPERKQTAERAPKGGITSKSKAGRGKGGERQTASRGSLLSYASHVRARVAGNKPSGRGMRGTAVISFGLTASGGLAYASVARSSGNASLDRLAVAAVRGAAPFPAPPAGATSGQLRFTIPFHFE